MAALEYPTDTWDHAPTLRELSANGYRRRVLADGIRAITIVRRRSQRPDSDDSAPGTDSYQVVYPQG